MVIRKEVHCFGSRHMKVKATEVEKSSLSCG
jgi:hypothetical protein